MATKIFLSSVMAVLLGILFYQNVSAQDQSWYFPIGNYAGRSQYKMFGQYFDKSSYVGKESLFPTQYTGYHAAADLEILPGEESADVPVYAVTDGKISFTGPVGGYGGVILLNMANDSHTAIYGHLKLSSSPLKTGDSVKAGQFLANLGKGYSSETGGERKHLHFGIYNGKGSYFKGYESSKQAIQSKWIDPGAYLKEKGAADVSQPTSDVSNNVNGNQNSKDQNIVMNNGNVIPDQVSLNQSNSVGLFDKIIQYLKSLFR